MTANIYYYCKQLGDLLAQRKWCVAVAESCTGGGLAQAITQVPGCSRWFDSGFVTYSNEAKIALLDVKKSILDQYGAVSKEIAYEMATGVIKSRSVNIAVSITGIAGPTGGTANKPVGTVWFGLALKDGYCGCRKMHFYSGREHVRDDAIQFALQWMLEAVSKSNKSE